MMQPFFQFSGSMITVALHAETYGICVPQSETGVNTRISSSNSPYQSNPPLASTWVHLDTFHM